MFVTFIKYQWYFKPIKLPIWSEKININWVRASWYSISYVFRIGIFWTTIIKIFFETIIVSAYCLKFLSSKDCLYWIKDAYVKIIFASGAPISVTLFFDSNNFFMSVSRWHFILKSILREKFLFLISEK